MLKKISSLSEAQSSLINKMAAKPETMENPFAATHAIQVRIDENVRLLAKLLAKREREDEIARNNSVCTITTTNIEASKPQEVPIPSTTMPKTNKNAEIFRTMGNNKSTTCDAKFDFD